MVHAVNVTWKYLKEKKKIEKFSFTFKDFIC